MPTKIVKNKKYLEAAEMIAMNWDDCIEGKTRGICSHLSIEMRKSFSRFFKPKNVKSESEFWWGEKMGSAFIQENQLARKIALNLMYEMGEK